MRYGMETALWENIADLSKIYSNGTKTYITNNAIPRIKKMCNLFEKQSLLILNWKQ